MEKVKFLILGGGAAGLSIANKLLMNGEKSFLVLEKEEEAGGLCRSEIVDGSPLDIGGGHFLDVRRPKVTEFLFRFMGETEWNKYERNSQIQLQDNITVSHPIEANLWQMPLEMQLDYLESIAKAGCNSGEKKPELFVDWIRWKLGEKIADCYMLPYNQKMFGDDLNALGTYWLEKLPDVSFRETLKGCLEKKSYGKQPGHAEFYYPKNYGYGEVWKRMADVLGEKIRYKTKVNRFILNSDALEVYDAEHNKYMAEYVITTIPWKEWDDIQGIPEELLKDIKTLKHTSVRIQYIPEHYDTDAQWIYIPDLKKDYHRLLIRSNFLDNSKGYWMECNSDRTNEQGNKYSWDNEYAYPLNTIGKPEKMKSIIRYMQERKVFPIGRWGCHEHFNSDAVVEQALDLADFLVKA